MLDINFVCSWWKGNNLQRVASLRHLQAISHQINLLTAGRFRDLDSFKIPAGINLDPVGHHNVRVVQVQGDRTKVYYHNRETGEDTYLLPEDRDWWVSTPLLVLQMDQGPICCAASAQLGSYDNDCACDCVMHSFSISLNVWLIW